MDLPDTGVGLMSADKNIKNAVYMIFKEGDILQITDPINFPLRIIGAGFEDIFIYYTYVETRHFLHYTLFSVHILITKNEHIL